MSRTVCSGQLCDGCESARLGKIVTITMKNMRFKLDISASGGRCFAPNDGGTTSNSAPDIWLTFSSPAAYSCYRC
jgi:hypothetical protein